MLAERKLRGRPMFTKPLQTALGLLLGLAGATLALGNGAMAAPTVLDSSTRVAVVVPIVLPETTTGLLDAETLTRYTAPAGLLSRQLDAVIDRQVALAIDPMIIVSIRILGTSAPATAVAWLDRLEGASNQTFPLAYADSDLTLESQAGSSSILGPASFDFAIDPSRFAAPIEETASPTPAPSPTPTGEPVEPVIPTLPTSESLLDWPYSLTGVAWPKPNSVVAADLDVLASSGYTTTILSSGNLTREGATAAVEIGGMKGLVTDDAVSDALAVATRTISLDAWQTALASLSSTLESAGGTTVVATLPRLAPTSGSRVAETLDAIAGLGVTMIPLSMAMGENPSAATIVDKPQDVARVDDVRRMLATELPEGNFATVAEDPAAITSPRRLELLSLLSNAWDKNPSGWATATTDFLTASATLLASVHVVESDSFNLVADRSFLPITVSNALDQPVTVYITVRAGTGLLAVEEDRVKLVVEPTSQATGKIPVAAISNGKVQLTVSLASPTGIQIGTPTRVTINVQAGWETPIVVVLASIVVLVFGGGIVRNIVRRRRGRPENAADSAGEKPADD